MRSIKVSASKEYEVYVGSGLLTKLGIYAKCVTKAAKIAIISDSNVWPLYGHTVKTALENAGFMVVSYVFPAGEENKNGVTYLSILEFLAENHLTRSDCLVALGGGVVGDITGFAAATYLRGVDYIQLPTTVLAAVDSSVGGKTAIDLTAGKNLVGTFCQPVLVLCDTDTLQTLPLNIFRDGCAEIIKYGVLYDAVFFDRLIADGLQFDREAVIARCVELKRNVVSADEFDRGQRQKLNLGHTVGHGIEAASRFTVSHGQAVAMGMAIISRASVKYSICSLSVKNQIEQALSIFGLPCSAPCSTDEIYLNSLSDKKRSGKTINLIVPEKIGLCNIRPTTIEELREFIEAGM